MANKLTISALKLHEKLTLYHACPYILYWDIKNKSSLGKYSSHPPNSPSLISWYLSTLIVFGGSFVSEGNFLILTLSPWNGRIPIISIGFSFLIGLLGFLALGINTVFFYHADKFAEGLNKLIEFGEAEPILVCFRPGDFFKFWADMWTKIRFCKHRAKILN
ncbi:unnamed protein product [Orchesella dallaii]|uniref:Photosystem I assembly protein Ycf4 n=1 Tax=Orchesella dallaii TaxID=48710 RepID=A0ABP1RJT9_9HEXA